MIGTVVLRFTAPNGRIWQGRYWTHTESIIRDAAERRGILCEVIRRG